MTTVPVCFDDVATKQIPSEPSSSGLPDFITGIVANASSIRANMSLGFGASPSDSHSFLTVSPSDDLCDALPWLLDLHAPPDWSIALHL